MWAGLVSGPAPGWPPDQRQQLLEVGLPHQIHRFAAAQALDVGGEIPLQPGRAAAQIDLKALAGRVIRQGGIAFGRPVLEGFARGGADEQGRFAADRLPAQAWCSALRGAASQGQIFDAELFGKGEKAVQHVGRLGTVLMVGEQPLAVVGPLLCRSRV